MTYNDSDMNEGFFTYDAPDCAQPLEEAAQLFEEAIQQEEGVVQEADGATAQPVGSAIPVDPVDPVDPADPATPIDPVDPVEEGSAAEAESAAQTRAAATAAVGQDLRNLAHDMSEAGVAFAQQAAGAMKALADRLGSEDVQSVARDAIGSAIEGINAVGKSAGEAAGNAFSGLASLGASVLGAGAQALGDLAERIKPEDVEKFVKQIADEAASDLAAAVSSEGEQAPAEDGCAVDETGCPVEAACEGVEPEGVVVDEPAPASVVVDGCAPDAGQSDAPHVSVPIDYVE